MRAPYVLQTALRAMWRAPALCLIPFFSMTAGLWLFGVVAVALSQGEQAMRAWAQGSQIACGIDPNVPERQWPQLLSALSHIEGVQRVELLDPEQSLQRLQADAKMAAWASAGLSAELLPASVLVAVAQPHLAEAPLHALAERIAAVPGVQDVDFGAAPLAQWHRAVAVATRIAWGLFALVVATLLVVLTGSIRLGLHARRDEVNILRLIGATRAFVRAPFVIEGVLIGVSAGAAAAGLSRLADGLFQSALQTGGAALGLTQPVHLFAPSLCLWQMGLGAGIGLFGSAVAVHAFWQDETSLIC